MMRESFNIVCLFGFSPHFREIAIFLDDNKITCIIVFSQRQKKAIESLDLPKSTKLLCVKSLSDASFQEVRVRDKASIGISFGSPFIFKQKDIDDFHGRLINSHGAPLPEFKGGGGFSWRILQRDKRGAVLMHLVTTQIDEGGCIFRKDFMFSDSERIPEDLAKRQLAEESEHLVPWIKQIICGQAKLEKLSSHCHSEDESSSYYPRLSSTIHGWINWSLNIKDLENFVHAFSRPYPGAQTFIRGTKAHIMDLSIQKECYMHPFTYGLIIEKRTESILISCNGGCILIKNNDLSIESDDVKLSAGDRFFTPLSTLEKAMSTRAFFKPDGLILRDYSSCERTQSEQDG